MNLNKEEFNIELTHNETIIYSMHSQNQNGMEVVNYTEFFTGETVKTAAFVHRVPLNNFIGMLETAIKIKE